MGMSSSQARLLSLTARQHDIELRVQKLQADKLRLANDSDRVYNTYLDALNSTKIQTRVCNDWDADSFKDATLASLENGLVATYRGEVAAQSLFLQDVLTNSIYITKDYADSIGVTVDTPTYNGTLEDYLIENNAPTKEETYISGYNSVLADLVIGTPVANKMQHIADADLLNAGEVYTISTADELQRFSEIVKNGGNTSGIKVVLTADIDMSGCTYVPIDNFAGEFDGNGHTIKNLNNSLFNGLDHATVKNLCLDGSNVSTGMNGALADHDSGSTISNIIIKNSSVRGIGSGIDPDSVGGMIGCCEDSKISQCSYSGSVSGNNSIGGLIGAAYRSEISDVSYTGNSGDYISGISHVGGVIGYMQSSKVDKAISNGADINSTSGGSGGLIGVIRDRSEVTNSASVDAKINGFSDVGGLIGQAGLNGQAGNNITVANCIVDNATIDAAKLTGGLIGSGSAISVDHCSSNSTITVDATNTSNPDSGGFIGIIANSTTTSTITNCSASGTITDRTTGHETVTTGFLGCAVNSSAEIANCKSNVNVNIVDNGVMAAGFASIHSTNRSDYSLIISNCDYTGRLNVAGTPYAATGYGTNGYNFAYSGDNSYLYLEVDNCYTNETRYTSTDGTIHSANRYSMNSRPVTTNIADSTFVTPLVTAPVLTDNGVQTGSIAVSSLLNDYYYIPSINSDKTGGYYSNIMAALIKSGLYDPTNDDSTVIDTAIKNYLAQYDVSNDADMSKLYHMNEYLCNYINGTMTNVTEITNFVNSLENDLITNNGITASTATYQAGAVLTGCSVRTDSETCEYTYNRNLVPIYSTRTVFDFDDPRTQELVNAYKILQNGFTIIGDDNDIGLDKSTSWLTNMVKFGIAQFVYLDIEPAITINSDGTQSIDMSLMEIKGTSVANETSLQEVQDTENVKKAESTYEADMKKINRKETKIDNELSTLETERTSIKSEQDTLKSVIKNNIDLSFKLFS